MKLVLNETSIPEVFSTEYESMFGIGVSGEEVEIAYKAIFLATADFLRGVKKKKAKSALSFIDVDGSFILAGVVEYNESDNKDAQDNWNFYFTFDEDDIKDASNKHDTNETAFHAIVTTRLTENGLRPSDASYISPMISMVAAKLSSFLDENAKATEEVELDMPGIFTCVVKIEDDKPVKSLLPDGEVKALIKDDASTEKE